VQKTPIAIGASPTRDIRIEISPNSAYVDEEIRICIRGLGPKQDVQIRAATYDDEKRLWCSRAEFRADGAGSVDLTIQESRGGNYRGLSPMGLFWSMHLDGEHANSGAMFAKTDVSPGVVKFEVDAGGRNAGSAELTRNFLAPGTETRDLNVNGHVGRLFLPPLSAGRGLQPVVIVLSGSGGGFDLDKAALLSRHGFATLALAYFGVAPLPKWLHRIPLDYFEGAVGWLATQPEIDSRRVGILGVSRGAELALLLATIFPQIRAVIAYAPSSVAWAAGGRDKITGEIIPTWMWRGAPVPFAPLPLRGFMLRSAVPVVALKRPVIFRNLFRAGLRNRDAIAGAAIPVEQIRGPILLVSGGDDHVWPASEMGEAIVARLKQHGFTHAVEHLHYSGAGHMLRYPFLPTTARTSRNLHLRNARFSFGGSAPADTEAQSDSWRRAIAFLQAHL
jgi:dienelactone hydrolase